MLAEKTRHGNLGPTAIRFERESQIKPETERVRRIWEKLAPRYDKDIKLFERVLFSGGREWVCCQAIGDV